MRTEEKDMCLAAENWEMAVAIPADLVKAEPKNPTTWILLAHAVRRAGNVEQGRRSFSKRALGIRQMRQFS